MPSAGFGGQKHPGSQWMLRPRSLQLAFDVVAVIFSLFAFLLLREVFEPGFRRYDLEMKMLAMLLSIAYWVVMFWSGGLYKDYYIRSPFEEFFVVLKQTLAGVAVLFFLIFIDSGEQFKSNPRFTILLYWIVLFLSACIGRLSARQLQRYLREHGIIRVPTVLVGTIPRLRSLLEDLHKEKAWGYDVLGVVPVRDEQHGDGLVHRGQPVRTLGSMTDLSVVLRQARPREVLISMEQPDHNELLEVTAQCADEDCTVKIVPDLYEIFSGQARTQQIYGAPLIEVSPDLMQPWEEFAKRTLDIVLSLFVLVLGMPVWLLVAALVKLTSHGPVFFLQDRVGRHGHQFKMFKFRSMVTDTSRQPSWTAKNDPRVTPVGRFIRKTHLDEIPQMWNVLKGEMSLVGPRPEQPFYVEKWSTILPYYRRRLKVRPGITGWWQVKAKSNPESVEEIQQRLRYDFFYIENMSFKLDLEILVRTVFVMIKGHGRA